MQKASQAKKLQSGLQAITELLLDGWPLAGCFFFTFNRV